MTKKIVNDVGVVKVITTPLYASSMFKNKHNKNISFGYFIENVYCTWLL